LSVLLQATSDFWRQKIRTMHSILDLNKDGVVSYEDFNVLSDRFIELGHLSKMQQAEFRKTMRVPISKIIPIY
jgi:hypothetical protein